MKKQLNERLEQLLAQKTFGELTAEERYFVTETLEETEYERMHFLVKNAPSVLRGTPGPNPAIRENLLAAMRQMKTEGSPAEQPGAIVRLLRARIPAWQAAAAVALLLGLHFLLPEKTKVEVCTDTEYVYRTDTIIKEVGMPATVEREAVLAKPKKRINIKPAIQAVDEALPPAFARADSSAGRSLRSEIPDTFALMVSQPKGQSARQTEDLWQFLGEVY